MHVICSGDGRNLAAKLTAAIAETRTMVNGCPGIISFGVAGGLAPHLRPGTCVVGSAVISGPKRMPISREWSEKLLRTIPDSVSGMLLGVPAPIAHPDEKRALYLRTGAIAVDMESHIAGAFAQAMGLPFAIVRVACDPAERALPPLAARAIKPNGGVHLPLVLRELVREPRQLKDLIRAGVDSGAAFATLRRCGGLLGPLFGLVRA